MEYIFRNMPFGICSYRQKPVSFGILEGHYYRRSIGCEVAGKPLARCLVSQLGVPIAI